MLDINLKDKVIKDITGTDDIVVFEMADGSKYEMWHQQDCCESVSMTTPLQYFDVQDVALANIDFGDEYSKIIGEKAKLDIQKEMLIKQKENIELQQKNLDSLDVDKYFKYQLIEKWDGKSNLFLSDNLLFSR